MGYRWAVLRGWPRREWLAVATIALLSAFLVSASVSLVVTDKEIAGITDDLDRNATIEYQGSITEQTVDEDAIVLPVTTISQNGTSQFVVGISPSAPTTIENASYVWADASLPPPPETETLLGPTTTTTQQSFQTNQGAETFRVSPSPSTSIFPPQWYLANAETVRSLGQQGGFVIYPYPQQTGSGQHLLETRLSSIGAYLENGAASLLDLLWLLLLIEGILISVLLYGITRISIRDRSELVFAIRATGGTRRELLSLFTLRATLRVLVGTTLGLGVGIALPLLVALSLGSIRVDGIANFGLVVDILVIVLPLLAGLVVIGGITAFLTTLAIITDAPTIGVPSTAQTATGKRGQGVNGYCPGIIRRWATTDILSWRMLLPTTATLAVFVCTILLIVSATMTLAPLATSTGQTITDPTAPHPLASNIDRTYAQELRAAGGEASPEILVPEVVGEQSQPYLARGVNFTAFAAVTEARLRSGHQPRSPTQAVIGSDLARTLDVQLGEEILLGGATTPGTAWVTVVGTYTASGITDDQLLIPLATAQHLSGPSTGEVNLIRTEGVVSDHLSVNANQSRTSNSNDSQAGIVVTEYSVPEQTIAGEETTVSAEVLNLGQETQSRTFTARIGPQSRTRTVTLAPQEQQTIQLDVRPPEPGTYQVEFARLQQNITVVPDDTVRLDTRPETAPPGSTLRLEPIDEHGNPVAAARLSLGNQTVNVTQNGTAAIPVPSTPGLYTLTVDAPKKSASSYPLLVESGASRTLSTDLEMPSPSIAGRSVPVAELRVTNPWNQQLTRTIQLQSGEWQQTREVTLAPSEHTTIRTQLPQPETQKGSLRISTVQSGTLTTGTYLVVQANSTTREYSTTSGLGLEGGIQAVLENLVYVQLAFGLFAGITVIGSVVVLYLQATQLRRRSVGIRRATGATPRQMTITLLRDGLRIGGVSTILALFIGVGSVRFLSLIGLLTAFGIQINPYTPPWFVISLGCLCLTFLGTGVLIAGLQIQRRDPATQSATTR